MAGIYIHIPFCKQACNYCDFHFSTSLKYKDRMLQSMWLEVELQKDYLKHQQLDTVYFGGGTPSILDAADLDRFFEILHKHFSIAPDAEITLEANPDDLNSEKLAWLGKSPVNRLSIGVQSFFDRDLQFMNRAHNAGEAEHTIREAQQIGIHNISIDLIYGTPGLTDEDWIANMDKAFELDVPHISSYALTVEQKTALEYAIRSGKVPAPEEGQAARQFHLLLEHTQANGYEQYELSNFCKDGAYSRHNSSYWKSESYLGIGPSAHSFNGESRSWNVASNAAYMKSLEQGKLVSETEILSKDDQYNEYIMTGLRTIWGCRLDKIESFGEKYLAHVLAAAAPYLKSGKLLLDVDILRAHDSGKFLLDRISSDLFYS